MAKNSVAWKVTVDTKSGVASIMELAGANEKTTKSMKKQLQVSKDLRKGLRLLKTTVGALIGFKAAQGIKGLSSSLLHASRVSERYRVTLSQLQGSNIKAEKTFDRMSKFAASVPFEFEKIMLAATRLSGVMDGGVDQLHTWMKVITDISASTGMSIEVVTAQIIRTYSAGIAAADLFRERGVTAALGFQAGMRVSAEDSVKQILQQWEDGSGKFVGASEKIAKTWDGLVSMMKDKWFLFRKDIGDTGPFMVLKKALSDLNERFNEAFRTGEAKRWAEDIAKAILKAMKNVVEFTIMFKDDIFPVIKTIFTETKKTWDSLPGPVKTFGILGALLFGVKGKLLLTGIMAATKLNDEFNKFYLNAPPFLKIVMRGLKPDLAFIDSMNSFAPKGTGGTGLGIKASASVGGETSKSRDPLKSLLNIINKAIEAPPSMKLSGTRRSDYGIAPKMPSREIVDPSTLLNMAVLDTFMKENEEFEKKRREQQLQYLNLVADSARTEAEFIKASRKAELQEYENDMMDKKELMHQNGISELEFWTMIEDGKNRIREDYRQQDLENEAKANRKKMSMAKSAVSELMDLTNMLTEAGIMGARESFRFQKAFSIASATIAALESYNKALAMTPPNPLLANTYLGLGMAKVAAISSTNMPSYDTGGISRTPGMYYAGIPEAHIPLKNGRSLPISFEGSSGAGSEVNITVTGNTFLDQETMAMSMENIARQVTHNLAPSAVALDYVDGGITRTAFGG